MTATEMALDERVREQEQRIEKLEIQVGLLMAGERRSRVALEKMHTTLFSLEADITVAQQDLSAALYPPEP